MRRRKSSKSVDSHNSKDLRAERRDETLKRSIRKVWLLMKRRRVRAECDLQQQSDGDGSGGERCAEDLRRHDKIVSETASTLGPGSTHAKTRN